MAIQSSWLLCQRLLQTPKLTFDEAANAYDRDWSGRIRPADKGGKCFCIFGTQYSRTFGNV